MTPDVVNSFFTPLHYFFYLFTIFVGMIVYYQWRWHTTCHTKMMILVQRTSGSGDMVLAEKQGGSVILRKPGTNTVRLWPINDLATVSVSYPGLGFIPGFLQKKIDLVVVDEDDWEPITNRNPHLERVASPDVVELLMDIADSSPEPMRTKINRYLSEITSAPTREMIASPAVLGNLIYEKITEVVMTVNKEVIDSLSALMRRMSGTITPTIFWIGLGGLAVVMAITAFQVFSLVGQMGQIISDLQAIKMQFGLP